MEELIKKIEMANWGKFTVNGDGIVVPNKGLTYDDRDEIIKYLKQLDEVQSCVKWYRRKTEHNVFKTPEEEQAYLEQCIPHKLSLATQVLNIIEGEPWKS